MGRRGGAVAPRERHTCLAGDGRGDANGALAFFKLQPVTGRLMQEIAAQTTHGRNPESYESAVTAWPLLAVPFECLSGVVGWRLALLDTALYGARQPLQAPFSGRA